MSVVAALLEHYLANYLVFLFKLCFPFLQYFNLSLGEVIKFVVAVIIAERHLSQSSTTFFASKDVVPSTYTTVSQVCTLALTVDEVK